LKFVTHSRANSRCWDWSSPTGTCVALSSDQPHLPHTHYVRPIFRLSSRVETEQEERTYEPECPPPAKLDMKKVPISTSPSPSHQADSHRLSTRVYSAFISHFSLPLPWIELSLGWHETYFPLRHPPKISHTRRTTQNPHQLRMLLHVTLYKHRTSSPYPSITQTQSQ
jgi:hypothetical protein